VVFIVSCQRLLDPQIEVATLQSRPEQFAPPSITVESSTSVTLVWRVPSKPNGYIVEYIIYEQNLGLITNISGSARQYTAQSKLLISVNDQN
jgi:hypothetical protein